MSELTFLQRCGAFVAAKEETDIQRFLDEANDAAAHAVRWPNPKAIERAVDLQWKYVDEVDRVRIWSPDQEEMALAEFALQRLMQNKGSLGVFDTPEEI